MKTHWLMQMCTDHPPKNTHIQIYADHKPTHQGVMQEYFTRVVFKDAPHAQLGLTLVGTTIEIFANMMGPLYQYLTSRYGVRPVLILGTLLVVLGLELSGFATKVCIT